MGGIKMTGELRLSGYAETIKDKIEKYVLELNKGDNDFSLKTSNLGGNYTACIRKVKIEEVEKTGWFGRKKKKLVEEYKPVMDIEYSAHTTQLCAYYDPKWKKEAENLEGRIGNNIKLSEAKFE